MSKRALLTTTIAAAALLGTATVAAQSGQPHQGYAYLGPGVGSSSWSDGHKGTGSLASSGGFARYPLNRYLMVEAFHADLGHVQRRGADGASGYLASTVYGTSLIGHYPVTAWFSPFARVGAANWETQSRLGSAERGLHDSDRFDTIYGIGAQFDFNPLQIRAEYERYELESDYAIESFSASVGLRF